MAVNPSCFWCRGSAQADYTRYEGMHLWQTMTGATRRPGQLLRRRLAGFLRPKCHPVLLDTAINSRTTVRLNIFQVCGACGPGWGRAAGCSVQGAPSSSPCVKSLVHESDKRTMLGCVSRHPVSLLLLRLLIHMSVLC